MKLEEIVKRIGRLMENEDRKDVEFRFIIAETEFGDIGKYITHDPALNPNARPHGTKKDEVLAYGQALVQIIALAQLRNVSLEESIRTGLENWEQADWRKSQASKEREIIKGLAITPTEITGEAYVVNEEHSIKDFSSGIIVTEYFTPDMVMYALKKAQGIVTNHGGATCHAANIAREYSLPCIVGTGDATEKIKHGDLISLENESNTGYVKIKDSKK